jgi:hypothetical protein
MLITSRISKADPTHSFRRSWLRKRPARKTSKVQAFLVKETKKVESIHDTQTGVPLGIPRGARCVQRFDDSLNSAIHITYRISLRSSSMREPRDPLLKVVLIACDRKKVRHSTHCMCLCKNVKTPLRTSQKGSSRGDAQKG